MSYDFYLRDPVSKDELQVPGHMMYGGNIKCDYIDGKLIPKQMWDNVYHSQQKRVISQHQGRIRQKKPL